VFQDRLCDAAAADEEEENEKEEKKCPSLSGYVPEGSSILLHPDSN